MEDSGRVPLCYHEVQKQKTTVAQEILEGIKDAVPVPHVTKVISEVIVEIPLDQDAPVPW